LYCIFKPVKNFKEKVHLSSLIFSKSSVFLPHLQNQTNALPQLTKPGT
jgi:hypothetical protein